MKEQWDHRRPVEGFEEFADHAELVDDPGRIEKYRAIGLAEGLQQGSESEVLRAWQWLSDHPEITNQLQEWFGYRVAELKSMGRIK
jgi:hypothetical protein